MAHVCGRFHCAFTAPGLDAAPPRLLRGAGGWEGCALRRLVAEFSLGGLAHFVRCCHNGVEAEVLRATNHSKHLALEVLNFFPQPVWVAISAEPLTQSSTATLRVQTFAHSTSCLEAPAASRAGSVVLCSLTSDHIADLLYCPAFSRTEIGEHVLRLHQPGDFLHFLFASSLSVGTSAVEGLADLQCRSEVGNEVLIPTTRSSHYPMGSWQREQRGLPESGDDIYLDDGPGGLALRNVESPQAMVFEFQEVLFHGKIAL
ncbi:unnamed protein product [Effrenium voratum]|uniref:Uncharacterized protein n=1 Tax=Effrenium voratum TaxID=2562239 RepID=A0AA36MX70_9DINO|nr:unnamed protein product [Effrenium voratum]CAJ1425228.1 unnamed protein product [Effrenium voratum]